MVRPHSLAWIALLAFAAPAFGDGMDPAAPPAAPAPAPAPAAKPAPTIASDEEAAAAIAAYKEAWKAKGLKGDDKLSQRDWALDELSKVQHPLVAAELGDVARAGEGDLKLIAVIYLARQKALPGVAGEQVLQSMQKNAKDVAFLLSALQTLGKLRYLGGDDNLKDLLKSQDWAVRKYAITAVGQVGDMRLVDELLKFLGVDLKNAPPPAPTGGKGDESGGKEVVEEGYSWDGAEATVDHGDADNTKENAEAKAKAEAEIARNKAEASGSKGAGGGMGGGGGGGDMGGKGGRGGSGRSPNELKPYVLSALKSLTGETFMNSREVRAWFDKNAAVVTQKKKDCDVTEATQRAEAKK
jgi:uncharacterized membrane protein YgcG